ncbi:hypothetical protein B7L39_01255 [Acinetobacter baumannii]|nr:hypothetical protein B7L39_01255 [Acinetobacter baumannii]
MHKYLKIRTTLPFVYLCNKADQLDNPNTPQEVKVKILCHDYPDVYKKQYMPALIKVSPKPYTEEKLLSDLKSATDYYKGTLGIKCNE